MEIANRAGLNGFKALQNSRERLPITFSGGEFTRPHSPGLETKVANWTGGSPGNPTLA